MYREKLAYYILLACSFTVIGDEHGGVALAMPGAQKYCNPGKDDPQFTQSLNNAKLAVDNLITARKAGNTGTTSTDAFRALKKAEEEARAFGNDDLRVADVQMLWGQYKTAVSNFTTEHYLQALAIREKKFGPDSVQVEEVLARLAPVYTRMGKPSEATDAISRASEIVARNKGQGAAYLADGFEQAVQNGLVRAGDTTRLARRVLKQMHQCLPASDPSIPQFTHVLALCEMDKPQGNPFSTAAEDPAINTLKEAIAAQEKTGGNKLQLASMYESLAKRQSQSGKPGEAAKTYESVVKLRDLAAKDDLHLLSKTYDTMAEYLRSMQQISQAEEYKKRALAIWERQPGQYNLNLRNGLNSMASFYRSTGQLPKAASVFERLVPLELEHSPANTRAIEEVAKTYIDANDFAKAEPWLKKWYAMRQASRPPSINDSNDGGILQVSELLLQVETKLAKLDEAGKYANVVKDFYDHQDKKFAMFGEIYPERFLDLYTAYLLKAGHTSEYAAYSARLAALRERMRQACLGCGRG
jgi:hypothetical protein